MRRTATRVLAAAVLATVLPVGIVSADVIELRDGSKITGTLVRRGDSMVITRADNGAKITVDAKDVMQVTLTNTLTSAEMAENGWRRLQMELGKATKLEDVVTKLETFANSNPKTPAGEKAATAAAAYRELLRQDPVKFRGQWVAKAQVEVIARAEVDQAKPIIALYKAGKLKIAVEQAAVELKTSPQNPQVLAVAGLASYRLNALSQAKEFFSRLIAADEMSVLGHNNLAVVSFQTQRPVDGLKAYALALQVAPGNRLLLDNVTEALVAAASVRNAPPYGGLARQYQQAEAAMEARLAKEGLFRYGSTWVNQQQRDRLVAHKAAVQAAMAGLEAQYAQAVRGVENVDAHLKMAREDLDAATNDFNTWTVQILYAQWVDTYALARRDAAAGDIERAKRRLGLLEDQRVAALESIRKIKTDAAKLKTAWDAIEKDQYTGVQRIMELGDDDTPPAPAAVSLPPQADALPGLRIDKPSSVAQLPQQSTREVRSPTYSYGSSIPYTTYGWVVPPVWVGPRAPIIVGGGTVGGNVTPRIPPMGPSVPMVTPSVPMFTPAGAPTPGR